jgi:hypothetical protein
MGLAPIQERSGQALRGISKWQLGTDVRNRMLRPIVPMQTVPITKAVMLSLGA